MNGLMEALEDNKDLTWVIYEWTNGSIRRLNLSDIWMD